MTTDPKNQNDEENEVTPDDCNEDEWGGDEIEDRSTDEFKHFVADKKMDAKRDDRLIKP